MAVAAVESAVDPRVLRSRGVILRAALAELAAAGYGGFTIESVAARAGVGKSTVYRHWPDRTELMIDAFRLLHEQGGPDLAGGSPRERLERVVRHVAEVVRESPFSACLPALIDAAERDPRLRRFHHEFQQMARRPLIALLAEGKAGGDFPEHIEPDQTAIALLGVIFFRRLMTPEPFDPGRSAELVSAVLGA